MILTAEQIKDISPATPIDRIKTFLPYLNEYLPAYGIDTATEVASYLAQVLHESGGFKWLREIWGPTPQQNRYERDFKEEWSATNPRNKLAFALGNAVKGDGKLFMGMGLMMYTGRTNYGSVSKKMFGDDRLLKTPELLATPQYGTLSSCIYWVSRNLDAVDDDLSIREETKKVNGGFTGLESRQHFFDLAIKILNHG